MKKYIVDEDWLKNVLVKASTYEALAVGGVDNWEGYREFIIAALEDIGCESVEEAVEKEILPWIETTT